MSLQRICEGDTWSLCEDGKPVLTVQETLKDGTVQMRLAGALRSDTEHYMKDELGALLAVGMNIVVDCQDLEYISYSCLLAFLSVQREMIDQWNKGTLTLCKVPEAIYTEMKKTFLHELLVIE